MKMINGQESHHFVRVSECELLCFCVLVCDGCRLYLRAISYAYRYDICFKGKK